MWWMGVFGAFIKKLFGNAILIQNDLKKLFNNAILIQIKKLFNNAILIPNGSVWIGSDQLDNPA